MIEHKILCIVAWLVIIVLECGAHLALIGQGNKPNYMQWFLVRGLAAILHGVLYDVQSWTEYIPLFTFQITSHFMIFNPLLNKLRGFGFWYLGEDSGWIDTLLVWRIKLYKVIYGLVCIGAVFSVVNMLT